MDNKAKVKATIGRMVKLLAVPIFIYLLFTILSGGSFGSSRSMIKLISSCCYSIAFAWGLMILWSTGIYDMSIGSVMLLGCIIGGNLSKMIGGGLPGMIICIILACVVIQTISALIHLLLNLPGMVVSFGLTIGYEALTQVFFNKKGVSTEYYQLNIAPWCYVCIAVTALLIILIYRYTKIGNHLNALGTAPAIAKNMGINIKKTKFTSFVISGVFIGIAAVMYLSKQANISAVKEMSSMLLTFEAVMSVFIGMFLSAYCNQVLATFVGTMIMNMLGMGLLSLGINSTGQNICQGIFLLLFMTISINQYRVLQYFKDRKRAKQLNEQVRIKVS